MSHGLCPHRSFHVQFLSLGIVYAGKPCTLRELKTVIQENIQEISEETLVEVETNFKKRLQICARENGHHLSNIIFCSKIFYNGIVQ